MNWMLVFVYATCSVIGFDASGHVSEETRNASVVSQPQMAWTVRRVD